MMMYVMLLIGFVLLIKGADFFVEGSSSIARALKIPSVIIGLTIVAMGTSAPEASVSLTAGLAGNSDISLSNIVGSNIFNLLVVIGVCALMKPIQSPKDILKRDLWWNLGITGILLLFLRNLTLERYEGIILFSAMVLYLIILIVNTRKNRITEESSEEISVPRSIIFILGGLAAVIFGGNLVVDNASLIASALGMSDTLIGLTIVAVGTSLPELVTSISAAKKGDPGIALGNAVGSSLFNIMFILGATSIITPLHASSELLIYTAFLLIVGIIIFFFVQTKEKTTRFEGVLCNLCYVVYLGYIIMR